MTDTQHTPCPVCGTTDQLRAREKREGNETWVAVYCRECSDSNLTVEGPSASCEPDAWSAWDFYMFRKPLPPKTTLECPTCQREAGALIVTRLPAVGCMLADVMEVGCDACANKPQASGGVLRLGPAEWQPAIVGTR